MHIGQIVSAIVSIISSLGYFGVAELMAIESACIPLPSEVIMPFGGCVSVNCPRLVRKGRERG